MLRVAEAAERTDTGRERTANEDSYFARAPVFAVADGMGGAQAGEVASKLATEAFEQGNETDMPPEVYLESITRDANRQINELARRDKERSGMGTTLTAAMVTGDELSIAHVGDSRAYLYRDGELRQLTTDHSLVEELRRQGRLTREEAAVHPQRSIITRALGPEPEVTIDTATYPARDGDLVLLCSDGLTAMVDDDRIAETIERSDTLVQVARTLVHEANANGGRDNITVVVFRLEEIGEAAAAADDDRDEDVTVVGMPAVAGPGGAEPAEAVPAVEPPLAASRAEPRPAPNRGDARGRLPGAGFWIKGAAAVLIAGLVVVAAVIGIRQVHFIGVDEGGRPALYRGLPYELPLGINLYDENYSLPIQATDVPAERRRLLTDHDLRSRDDAVSLLRDLESDATAASEPPQTSKAGSKGGSDARSGKQ